MVGTFSMASGQIIFKLKFAMLFFQIFILYNEKVHFFLNSQNLIIKCFSSKSGEIYGF